MPNVCFYRFQFNPVFINVSPASSKSVLLNLFRTIEHVHANPVELSDAVILTLGILILAYGDNKVSGVALSLSQYICYGMLIL